ncbi:hypothetical protein [Bradyrhizobium sp. CCBAU 51753]|nr:hypothetical protein [Bradyrhizobium sp. CCBAU 51753]
MVRATCRRLPTGFNTKFVETTIESLGGEIAREWLKRGLCALPG